MVIFNFTGDLQTFTVPVNVCTVTIRAEGAQGGFSTGTTSIPGGLGASIQGDFTVAPGETLSILVGGAGESNVNAGGGGGGAFIWRGNDFTDLSLASLLIAAGGGGGGGDSDETAGNPGIDASIDTNGTAGNLGGAGGTNGNGGDAGISNNGPGGGGGAGIFTDGGSDPIGGNGGTAIVAGGMGGTDLLGGNGGFGGGGSGSFNGGGGGGGFSGGGGGQAIPNAGDGGGGGGGSFNSGNNQINIAGAGTGNGVVEITLIPDTIPPMIECPSDITVFNDPGSNGAIVNYSPPTVSDNCSAVTAVCTPESGSFFPPGTTTVTCTATDAAGNRSACSFNVRVIVDPCRFFSGRCSRS